MCPRYAISVSNRGRGGGEGRERREAKILASSASVGRGRRWGSWWRDEHLELASSRSRSYVQPTARMILEQVRPCACPSELQERKEVGVRKNVESYPVEMSAAAGLQYPARAGVSRHGCATGLLCQPASLWQLPNCARSKCTHTPTCPFARAVRLAQLVARILPHPPCRAVEAAANAIGLHEP